MNIEEIAAEKYGTWKIAVVQKNECIVIIWMSRKV